jgi:hypothetical protein
MIRRSSPTNSRSRVSLFFRFHYPPEMPVWFLRTFKLEQLVIVNAIRGDTFFLLFAIR